MSGVWIGTRRRVYERDGLRCAYCGIQCVERRPAGVRRLTNLATVDHVVPAALGGGNGADNLVTACFTCNTQKGRRSRADYEAWKASRP